MWVRHGVNVNISREARDSIERSLAGGVLQVNYGTTWLDVSTGALVVLGTTGSISEPDAFFHVWAILPGQAGVVNITSAILGEPLAFNETGRDGTERARVDQANAHIDELLGVRRTSFRFTSDDGINPLELRQRRPPGVIDGQRESRLAKLKALFLRVRSRA
ncbi:hypothetical protein RWH45_06650 [Microbacterium sp. KSW4-17]|uniref:Uncharacterized protein n=1 Tax=Microbacterium galbum TaxID=3075994 RepID=A0ABU3T686_9MICO|nr:hypothetical protein [Microbacterium sp. KSW4-17]MDU0366889.1 hypothetical protein [Microbacterium sp. KSW4-17]